MGSGNWTGTEGTMNAAFGGYAGLTTFGAGTYQYTTGVVDALGYAAVSTTTAGAVTFFRQAATAFATTGSIRTRFYMAFSVMPTTGQHEFMRIQRSNGTQDIVSLWLNTNGTIAVKDIAGTTLFTTTKVFAINTWYRFEVMVTAGTTTTNGKIGFAVPATAQGAVNATNSSTNVWYYNAACNTGASVGASNTDIGKLSSTLVWSSVFYLDEYKVDNNTWSNTLSTWIGPAPILFQDVITAGATASASFNNPSTTTVVFGALGGAAPASLVINPDLTKNGTVVAPATAGLALAGAASRSQDVLPASVTASMALAPGVSRSPALPASAAASLALAIFRQSSSVLALQGGAGLALAGYGSRVADVLPMVVSSSALYGPQIDHPVVLGVSVPTLAAFATQGGWSLVLTAAGQGGLTVVGRKDAAAVLAAAGVGALALTGRKDAAAVLAARGLPTLAVAGQASRGLVLAVRATPGLTVAGLRSALSLLVARAVGQLVVGGRVIGVIYFYDNVLAIVLDRGGEVSLLPNAVALEVLANGRSVAAVLNESAQAEVIPGGMLAVIQE